MAKRRRIGANVVRAARRPIDKSMIVVNSEDFTTQASIPIQTSTVFPGTLTGLRWSLGFVNSAGTAIGGLFWSIVVVPQGTTASTMSTTNAATFYSPEQNVLTFGSATSLTSVAAQNVMFEGSTKSMRKLKVGDTVVLLVVAQTNEKWTLHGVVQFFIKS